MNSGSEDHSVAHRLPQRPAFPSLVAPTGHRPASFASCIMQIRITLQFTEITHDQLRIRISPQMLIPFTKPETSTPRLMTFPPENQVKKQTESV